MKLLTALLASIVLVSSVNAQKSTKKKATATSTVKAKNTSSKSKSTNTKKKDTAKKKNSSANSTVNRVQPATPSKNLKDNSATEAVKTSLPVIVKSKEINLKNDSLLAIGDTVINIKAVAAKQRAINENRSSFRRTLDAALESFMPFQFKYAILLNETVEKITNVILYKTIDDWYGTRYRYGGTTEKGIDCSAFMQVLASYSFGWLLPRTAREQYAATSKIPKNELQEGDFVFFNTTGGVSHVGMYLHNDKFIHSSSSEGVSIGDLNSKYWSARFLGARRLNSGNTPAGNSVIDFKMPNIQ